MEKKYELIDKEEHFYRVRALKDFTLITGETVKKGDKGGYIKSEDCLSQEGLCWVMYGAHVEGTVSDNAVVQDSAIVYGTVSGNAVVQDSAIVYGTVSGNAVVKDNATVYYLALVTDDAVVKEHQRICCGVVTTDLLRYKQWSRAMFAELGVTAVCGKALLCIPAYGVEEPNVFFINDEQTVTIGKEFIATAENGFSQGIDLTTADIIEENGWLTSHMIVCLIDVNDIIDVQEGLVVVTKFVPICVE